jgi:hypothetical protein
MDVVENVVDGDTILDQVDPENRDIFREIFLNDDSEEEFLESLLTQQYVCINVHSDLIIHAFLLAFIA